MSDNLPYKGTSGHSGALVVLLHGFGGSAASWDAVQARLEDDVTVAFDLPGHGEALGREDLSTIDARNAVIAEMETDGMEDVHLVGHSRGGAVACLVAAKVPDRIASLTLLAPGGFGPQIAAAELEAFAAAEGPDAVRAAMDPLYAPSSPSRKTVLRTSLQRKDARAIPALRRIASEMLADGRQGTLDLDRIARTGIDTMVIWGELDAVLPVAQAHAMPGAKVRILPGLGHMLPDEAPDMVADAIRSQFGDNPTLTDV